MSHSFDVIVVGLGAMGSSALFHLARRGLRVLGIDRFHPPHALGSSHGQSRVIRLCYFEHPDYVPLLHRAYELWRQLQSEARQPLLHITGALYLGPPDCASIAGCLRSARAHNLEHELLASGDIRRRYPQFAIDDHTAGFYEPTAGLVLPERTIAAHLDLAARLAAQTRLDERVLDWSADARAVRVRTDRAEYAAEKLILSAGAWMGALEPALAPKLNLTRQTLAWFDPIDPAPLHAERLPVWFFDAGLLGGRGDHYGFPMLSPASPGAEPPGGRGFKLALHKPGPVIDAEDLDRTPDPADAERLLTFLKARIPAAAGTLLHQRVCLYASTPDQHFVIDRHPKHERVILASPCSGHGFKFAPVVGEILADLAERGATRHPIGFLSLNRFAASR